MLRTIQQPLTSTEIPLVITYCYADISSGSCWDTAFDSRSPKQPVPTNAVCKFGVVHRSWVTEVLPCGLHLSAVIAFPEGAPEIMESLPFDSLAPDDRFIGLCQRGDQPAIADHLSRNES